MITFKLVEDQGRQRFYEASQPIIYGEAWGEARKIADDIERVKERIKPEYRYIMDDYIPKYVCVSDAKTHAERLLFLALKLPEEVSSEMGAKYKWLNLQLGGQHTMMIDGGDVSSMREDKVYLRRLSIINSRKN